MNEYLIIAGIVGTGVTGIIAYLFGGSIRKTDANRLWDENKDMRKELKEDNRRLEGTLRSTRLSNHKRWQVAIPILQACAKDQPDLRERISLLLGMLDQEQLEDNGA